jgi:hypothetical protein
MDNYKDNPKVTINGSNLVVLDDSTVTAQASQGRGGVITENSQGFLHDRPVGEVLTASAGRPRLAAL